MKNIVCQASYDDGDQTKPIRKPLDQMLEHGVGKNFYAAVMLNLGAIQIVEVTEADGIKYKYWLENSAL